MSIAKRVRDHLDAHGIVYDCLQHRHTETSQETAEATHVPGDRLAKGVVLEKQTGEHILAVLPATHVVHYSDIEAHCGSPVKPAAEELLEKFFTDCEVGAVPPFGDLYGLPTLVDEALLDEDPIFFEAGDHESAVRLSAADFRSLLAEAEFFGFSMRPRRDDT